MYKISIRDVELVERCNILLIRNEDGVYDTIVRPVNLIESVDTEDPGIRVCTFSHLSSPLTSSQTPTTTNRYAHSSSEKMVLSGDHFSVGNTIGSEQRAKLQNCFAQFQQYGALMKPLMSGMNDMSDRLNPKPTASNANPSSEEKRYTNNEEEEEEEKKKTGNSSGSDDTKRRHSKTRKNRIKFEDEKIKLERGRRKHQRGRYKPTTKLWDMLDELEEVKSKARK